MLELRDGRQDVEQRPPGQRRGVDRLVEHHEVHPERLKLLGEPAPGETVELHARDHIDLAASRAASRASRHALAPEFPRSTYSVAVQLRASANARSARSWVSGVCPGSPGARPGGGASVQRDACHPELSGPTFRLGLVLDFPCSLHGRHP